MIVDRNNGANHGEIVSEQDRVYIKDTYNQRIERKPFSDVKITDSFYKKIEPVYMNLESTKLHQEKNTTTKKILRYLFKAPIIAMFVGFVVGFIEPIRTWLLRTDTAVYVIIS